MEGFCGKARIFVTTNYKIYKRLKAQQNPIVASWMENVGFKFPPDIIAYIFIIFFFTLAFLGAIAESKTINTTNTLNLTYCSIYLIALIVIIEFFITFMAIRINPILYNFLPYSRKEKFFLMILVHFLSLRTIGFIFLIISYLVFSSAYNYKVHIESIILFVDIFILTSGFTFVLSFKNKKNKIKQNPNTAKVLRLFFVLIFIAAIIKGGVFNSKQNFAAIEIYINSNLMIITTFAVCVFPIIFLSFFKK